mmetsp:Transcript_14756/g.37120  ORF Transcript_14756/g.37120 Transcript_14756/m.37120 type:complete len:721 (+) Transcript_14756:153-2315(+)
MKTKSKDGMTEKVETDIEIDAKKRKKEKKEKKKEKKKKRKRKRGESADDTDDDKNIEPKSTQNENGDGDEDKQHGIDGGSKKKKRKEKKSKKAKKKSKESSSKDSSDDASIDNAETTCSLSVNGRLVASSAIEFYDDDLKKKVKKRQKLATGSSGSGGVGLEDVLEAQRSKQSKAKTKRSRSEKQEQLLAEQKKRDELDDQKRRTHSLTLLLFYQYIEPEWDDETYEKIIRDLKKIGTSLELTGRMRCAKEGLNCTLTGTHQSILEYTKSLQQLRPNDFKNTEFKLTTDLPLAQKFGELKVLPVAEIVKYGLEGEKAPPIQQYSGVHLEPKDYHKKLAESNTVIIDVRNHYEASIGRFIPPNATEEKNPSNKGQNGPLWIDPKMRKSTEFPAWLDKDETKEMMKGKQVLMYCTGGIRCERASALLKYKMETDDAVKDLGIKGVFQLQGGIDKYFKEFPDGGYWKGKNYVFDKRFAHAPPKIDGELHGRAKESDDTTSQAFPSKNPDAAMGKCEGCLKPWDMYRGKRRCPTCGVPSLICKECFLADKNGTKKLGRDVRCDLCVEQNIHTKREYREKDERFIADYESKMMAKGLLLPGGKNQGVDNNHDDSQESVPMAPNPKNITRLVLKNMCRKNMTEEALMEAIPGITHIVWHTIRNRKNPSGEPIFMGMGWVEMATPEDAARAVAQNNKLKLFRRPVGIAFQPPDGKDIWPPSSSKVGY